MEGRATKAPRVSARFSKSLESRRLRPNQEKVRSTTQRRGRATKPFVSSLCLTISRRRTGILATAASTIVNQKLLPFILDQYPFVCYRSKIFLGRLAFF